MNLKLAFLFLTILTLLCCGTFGQKESNERHTTTVINGDSILRTGWYYIIADTNRGYRRQLDKDTTYYLLNPEPIVTARNITTMEIYEGFGDIGLAMQLDDEGADLWSEATDKATGKYLGFVLNDKLLHVPRVNSQILGGKTALNRGKYSRQELNEFKKQIEKEQR